MDILNKTTLRLEQQAGSAALVPEVLFRSDIAADMQSDMLLTLSVIDGAPNTNWVNRMLNEGSLATAPAAADPSETGSSQSRVDYVFHSLHLFGRYKTDGAKTIVNYNTADTSCGRAYFGGQSTPNRDRLRFTWMCVAKVTSYADASLQGAAYNAPSFMADAPKGAFYMGIVYSSKMNGDSTAGVAFTSSPNGAVWNTLYSGVSDTTTYHQYSFISDNDNVLGFGTGKIICRVDGAHIGTLAVSDPAIQSGRYDRIEAGHSAGTPEHYFAEMRAYPQTLTLAQIIEAEGIMKARWGTP